MSAEPEFMRTFAEPIPQPLGYHVVIRPKPAQEQKGSILLAGTSMKAEMASRTVGQIVAKGYHAWLARFASTGIDYQDDPVVRGIKVGDWVIYRQHAGQRIKFTDEDPEESDRPVPYLLIMSDTDILAKLTPEQAEQAYDWI